MGCLASLREGDLVTAAVVVLKGIQPDGTVRLNSCWSDGLCWVDRIGMLRAAEASELPDPCSGEAYEPEG